MQSMCCFQHSIFHSFIGKSTECHLCPSMFCLDGSLAVDGVWHLFMIHEFKKSVNEVITQLLTQTGDSASV